VATYASIDDLRGPAGYLNEQFTTDGVADATHDAILTDILERATAFVNAYLGTTTNLTLATSSTRTLYGDGGLFLSSDVPMTTVTLVAPPSGYSVPEYIIQDGVLRVTDSNGVIVEPWYPALGNATSWPYASGWQRGVPYSVTATFGYSADDLAVLAEATLQTAVQLWQYRGSGGSATIGSDDAITTVRAGWTPLVKQGLDSIKRRMRGNSVGVW